MAKPMGGCWSRRWFGHLRAIRVVLTLGVLSGFGIILRAAGLAQPPSDTSNAITCSLEYQESTYTVCNQYVSVLPQSVPFTREPAGGSGKTLRGILTFFGGSSNAVPFLWQRDARKLYLDLNRNRDLTDDPDGVFVSPATTPVNSQTFTNVHLLFRVASNEYPALVDFTFLDGSPLYCYAAGRSFWQGRLSLHGSDWQIGLVPTDWNQPLLFERCQLLLRSWQDRDTAFYVESGSLDTFSFPPKLFVDGHAYHLALTDGKENGTVKPGLRLTEQTVALGELKITGQFIKRLLLPGGPYLVVLDQPAGDVQVPAGTYSQPSVRLEKSGIAAFDNGGLQASSRRIVVNGKTPAILAAGGPLTNSVAVSRHGRDLLMNYQLIGPGGQTYQPANRDYSHPPEFAIYKGEKKIASGKFEFG